MRYTLKYDIYSQTYKRCLISVKMFKIVLENGKR
jgi:hypothetical protein